MVGVVGLAVVVAVHEEVELSPCPLVFLAVAVSAQLVGFVQPGAQVFEDDGQGEIEVRLPQRIGRDDEVRPAAGCDEPALDLDPCLVEEVLVIA